MLKVSSKQMLAVAAIGLLAGTVVISAPGTALAKSQAEAALVKPAAAALVNINKASAEELDTLRGIGPVMAQRIIEYREQNGGFKTVDDLASVRGIGGSKLQKIKDQITI